MQQQYSTKMLLFGLFLLFLATEGHTAKILVVFPTPAPSHYILERAYTKALAEAGHDVTVITPFEEKSPPKNGSIRIVLLEGFLKFGQERQQTLWDRASNNPFFQAYQMLQMTQMFGDSTFSHPAVQKLMNSGEKFDVVVVGQFLNDAMKAFAWHFGGHLVIFSSLATNSWINPLVCNPSPPAYVPEVLLNFSSNMTFYQRLINTIYKVFDAIIMNTLHYPKQAALVQKYFPQAPPFEKILYNTSLVLLNSHESLSDAVPHVPSLVDIGGFHVKKPKKLPKDLQEFLDGATEGAVYFSMGSNLKSKDLPEEKRDAILKAFSKLKQKVLWKWEADVLPGQPENVKLGKWLPQQDILAHPNVKLFVTHGGLLSTTETIYHGVPIIAIPIFGDQFMNAVSAENNGYARIMRYSEITEETFSSLLEELLNNPKYRENAQTRSRIMHDREVQPLDNAVYWTEYVIKHNGALHLRVAGLELPWYQYHLLDVAAVLLVGVIVVLFVVKKLLCCVWCWLTNKKTRKIKKH